MIIQEKQNDPNKSDIKFLEKILIISKKIDEERINIDKKYGDLNVY